MMRISPPSCVSGFVRSLIPAILLVLTASACSGDIGNGVTGPSNPATENFAAALGIDLAAMTQVSSRLYVQDLVLGTGIGAANGDSLRVRYTGWLRTGVKFDGNAPAGVPFGFRLGVLRVIPGWDVGLLGVRAGSKRRLVFGSEYGYGALGSGTIPPNATLVFDVDIVEIVRATPN